MEDGGMAYVKGPYEREPSLAPEFTIPDDPEFDSVEERANIPETDDEATDPEESFGAGVFGPKADGRRKSEEDDDDDSDADYDDFDYDDDADDDEDVDDDLDDDTADDFDEDVDESLERDEQL
jgi:hypothetical protein